jgi:hypothetical protein
MHPTTAFAAPFGFVGWTIPSPLWGACRLVSTPSSLPEAWLGITISCDVGFPEFDRCHLKITPQAALGNVLSYCLKPAALTTELWAQIFLSKRVFIS